MFLNIQDSPSSPELWNGLLYQTPADKATWTLTQNSLFVFSQCSHAYHAMKMIFKTFTSCCKKSAELASVIVLENAKLYTLNMLVKSFGTERRYVDTKSLRKNPCNSFRQLSPPTIFTIEIDRYTNRVEI